MHDQNAGKHRDTDSDGALAHAGHFERRGIITKILLYRFIPLLLSAISVIGQGDTRAELERARELIASGKPLEAATIYEGLLKADPRNASLLLNLAVARFKAARYDAVVPACRKALEMDPSNPGAWLFLGASYFQLQRPSDAIGPLTRAVELRPEERNARLMLAESLLLEGRPGEAAPHFEISARLMPDTPRAWYGLERSCSELAIREENELATLPESSALFHAVAGDAALRRRRFGLALREYRKALEFDAGLKFLHDSIAQVYRDAGKPDFAAAEAKKGCGNCAHPSAGDRDPAASLWRARSYRERAEKARASLEALPPSPQMYELRARRLEEEARSREAAVEWRAAIRAGGETPALLQGLAVSLLNAGDAVQASPEIETLLKLQPDSVQVQLLAGRLQLALEQPGSAVSPFRRALELDPESVEAKSGLGEALLKSGKPEEAIPFLKASAAADPSGVRHFQLARAYQATNQADAARESLHEYQRRAEANEAARRELERDYSITPP